MGDSRYKMMALKAAWVVASAIGFPLAGYVPSGYWTVREPEDYEEYIRIQGNAGFLCVLDNKSSFRFAVIGDSITTPMNGMNSLTWFPGSGDIQISGVEKGEPYSTRYKPSDSATYASKCRAEEAGIPVRVDRPLARTVSRPAYSGPVRDALGRSLGDWDFPPKDIGFIHADP